MREIPDRTRVFVGKRAIHSNGKYYTFWFFSPECPEGQYFSQTIGRGIVWEAMPSAYPISYLVAHCDELDFDPRTGFPLRAGMDAGL